MLPADIPEFNSYPNVCVFVKGHLSMQFGDVRSMLRLPLPSLGINHGCNFSATATLCNIISGISVSLYMPANPVREDRKRKRVWIGSGEAFKLLLENFYPWEPSENKTEKARVLYYFIRNALAHALAVHSKTHYQIEIDRISVIQKGNLPTGLREDQLKEIEISPNRPSWLPSGLSGAGKQWKLHAEGFYRDVFHMLWKLARDSGQMREAEKRFSAGKIIWRQGKA